MPNTIPTDHWLRFIDEEYLSSFIRDGGASVKFAVTPEEVKTYLNAALEARCRELGYLFVKLDPFTVVKVGLEDGYMRAYMPQDIFHGLAQQVDWRLLARRIILRYARERRYQVGDIDPAKPDNIFEAIATAMGSDVSFLLSGTEILGEIQNSIFRNSKMVKDFRVAMSQLCLAENTRQDGEYYGRPILDWLTGRNTGISGVSPFSIYTTINRTTARYFIESALYWIHYAGCSGTVIALDNSRVTLARNPRDGLRYYTRANTVEHYELLREFIDSVDRLTGTLLVVAANQDFIEEDAGPRSRGYGIYPALRTRVMDDVRDRNLVNPVASLVRLS